MATIAAERTITSWKHHPDFLAAGEKLADLRQQLREAEHTEAERIGAATGMLSSAQLALDEAEARSLTGGSGDVAARRDAAQRAREALEAEQRRVAVLRRAIQSYEPGVLAEVAKPLQRAEAARIQQRYRELMPKLKACVTQLCELNKEVDMLDNIVSADFASLDPLVRLNGPHFTEKEQPGSLAFPIAGSTFDVWFHTLKTSGW